MSLITFILICFGLTQILVYGRLFDTIRPDLHLFHCSMCVGFWVGIAVSVASMISKILFPQLALIDILLLGFLSSGTSYIIDMLIGDEGFNITKGEKRNE